MENFCRAHYRNGQKHEELSHANDTLNQPLDRVNRQFHAEQPNQLWGSKLHLCFDLAELVVCGLRR